MHVIAEQTDGVLQNEFKRILRIYDSAGDDDSDDNGTSRI